MSISNESQEASLITPSSNNPENTPNNPNRKRNTLIAGSVGAVTLLAAATFGGIAANNSAREARLNEKSITESIAEEQANAGNDIIENPSIDVPAETSPPIEAPATPEQDVVSANTLTDDQIHELLDGCPRAAQFYSNPLELIREFSNAEAQAVYKTFQTDPEAGEEYLLGMLALYYNK